MKASALFSNTIRAVRRGRGDPRPVFILGCGRSGTHLLANALSAHPSIHATIEAEPMFGLSTALAMDPRLEPVAFAELVHHYRNELGRSPRPVYVDKSHPNLWLADKLQDAFPEGRFLGIERNVFATVASMMKHRGVSAWHFRWKEFPVPNRFLGITDEWAAVYDDLSLAARCALRWRAHKEQMVRIRYALGARIAVLSYEQLVSDAEASLRRLREFLELDAPIPVPAIDRMALTRWSRELSEPDRARICDVVGDWAGIPAGEDDRCGRS